LIVVLKRVRASGMDKFGRNFDIMSEHEAWKQVLNSLRIRPSYFNGSSV
jgi:hypothetical protein